MSLVVLLAGLDVAWLNVSLVVDGMILALGIAIWQDRRAQRPPYDRVLHGLASPPGVRPTAASYVLSARSRRDVRLGQSAITLRFAEQLTACPTLRGNPHPGVTWDPADKRTVQIGGFTLPRDEDVFLQFSLPEGARPAEPEAQHQLSPDTVLLPLHRVRRRSKWRAAGAAAAAVTLLLVGVGVGRFVVEPFAPLAGRILIAVALVPIGIGLVNSAVLDRYRKPLT